MSELDISEVAQRTGLPASTLRFYEEKGLIQSVGRSGLRRLFSEDIVERLGLISLGQASGFSLEEIGSMFTPEGGLSIDRAALSAKADEIDKTVRKLTVMSQGLRHAAACPASSHMECDTFQRLIKVAASHVSASRVKSS